MGTGKRTVMRLMTSRDQKVKFATQICLRLNISQTPWPTEQSRDRDVNDVGRGIEHLTYPQLYFQNQ